MEPTQLHSAATAQSPSDLLDRQRLDAFTHARLWRNPCGFAARFNYLALRYNHPLYTLGAEAFGLSPRRIRGDLQPHADGRRDGERDRLLHRFPKNTLSRAVGRLDTLGLIARGTGSDDRRAQPLTLTDKGRAVLDEAVPRFVAIEEEMLAPLSLVRARAAGDAMAKVVLAMFHGDDAGEGAGRDDLSPEF